MGNFVGGRAESQVAGSCLLRVHVPTEWWSDRVVRIGLLSCALHQKAHDSSLENDCVIEIARRIGDAGADGPGSTRIPQSQEGL
jgi:hypothetical protein